MRFLPALIATLLLAGCVRMVPESRPPAAPPPPVPAPTATPAPTSTPTPTPTPPPAPIPPPVSAGPSVASLRLTAEDARGALSSFIESCPRLVSRTDNSKLTTGADWRTVCDRARAWPAAEAVRFFESEFETARVGDGKTFITGYFEPEIAGCRTRQPGCEVPVYRLPPDLVRAWPADMPLAERTGNPPLGRTDETGNHVPYYDRAEIEDGALANKGLEIAWAADPVEFFFLQIQGSGLLRLPDGSLMRIGYAGQNGRGYVGIGSLMRERGLLGEGPGQYAGSMQGLMAYIRENDEAGRALMRENPSWVFFREVVGDGPFGSLNVPVRANSSVATDPNYIPLGAPVWLDVDRAEADGLWIAQDTGGAIKGVNRFDTFWGNGPEARLIAGGMSSRGQSLLLLPKGVLARLTGR
jgi:membrane-bound lytic murein transglycosylase A